MILMVTHKVRDFDAWKRVFEEHESVRARHGAKGHTLYRRKDDPNLVAVANEFPNAEGAAAFLEDPSLKEAMERAGVEGMPTITMWDEAETRSY